MDNSQHKVIIPAASFSNIGIQFVPISNASYATVGVWLFMAGSALMFIDIVLPSGVQN